MTAIASTPSPHATVQAAQLRTAREAVALRAVIAKRDFAPAVYGWNREQQALLSIRVVLDTLETVP